ncbi:MAG: autotransporter-associated beta strand repeat-containing protein [Alphaproteobacteria bacterium]
MMSTAKKFNVHNYKRLLRNTVSPVILITFALGAISVKAATFIPTGTVSITNLPPLFSTPQPSSIICDPITSMLFVLDQANSTVLAMGMDGVYSGSPSSLDYTPARIAFNSTDGNIYVDGQNILNSNNTLHIYNSAFQQQNSPPYVLSAAPKAIGAAYDQDLHKNTAYLAYGGTVDKMNSADGTIQDSFNGPANPAGIAVAPDITSTSNSPPQHIYISGDATINVFNGLGANTNAIFQDSNGNPVSFTNPSVIAISDSDDKKLIIADGGRLKIFTPVLGSSPPRYVLSRTLNGSGGTAFSQIDGVTLGPSVVGASTIENGNVFVVNRNDHKIYRFFDAAQWNVQGGTTPTLPGTVNLQDLSPSGNNTLTLTSNITDPSKETMRLNVDGSLIIGTGNTLDLDSGGLSVNGTLGINGGTLSVTSGTYDLTSSTIGLTGGETIDVKNSGDKLVLPDITIGTLLNKTGLGVLAIGSLNQMIVGSHTLKISGGSITGGSIDLDGGTLWDNATTGTSIESDISLTSASNTLNVSNASEIMTLSGNISGSGGFIKTGTGTVTLLPAPSKALTYTGPTLINAGQLIFPSGLTLTPVTIAGGNLGYVAGTIFQNLTFSGGNIASSVGNLPLTLGTNSSEATVTTTVDTTVSNDMILAGNTTFTMGTLDQPSTLKLTKNVSGHGGLTVDGPGMLVLSGNVYDYSGPTKVSSGRIHLGGGSLDSSVTVDNGATFSGTGRVLKNITNSGTVEPSSLLQNGTFIAGTMVVDGTYTQTGTLAIRIGKSNNVVNASLLHVAGKVTLDNGSTIAFLPSGDGLDRMDASLEGTTYTILSSDQDITGFFTTGTVDASSIPGINFRVVGPSARTGNNPGQEIKVILHPSLNAATTASSVTLSTNIIPQTIAVISNQIAKSQSNFDAMDVDTISNIPEDYTGRPNQGYNPPIDSFRSRQVQSPQGWDTLLSALDKNGSWDFTKEDEKNLGKTFWLAPLYVQGRNKQTPVSGASSDHMQLLLTGMEWHNSDNKSLFGISLGGGFGGAKSSMISTNKSQHKMMQISAYNSMRWDNIRLDAFVNASRMFSKHDRVANVSTGYIIKSSSIADALGSATEISYKVGLGSISIRPYYGINLWTIKMHGYKEMDNSIYSNSVARTSGMGFDNYIGTSVRNTWTGVGIYSLRVEGSIYYSYTIKDPNLMDTTKSIDGSMIRSVAISGYGRGAIRPSLTLSAMNQDTRVKYLITGSTTIQSKRTEYHLLCKASFPF